MRIYKRAHNKWTINELNRLQREYELLELTVQEISEKHERSIYAILYKLESEGMIQKGWSDARGISNVFPELGDPLVIPSANYETDDSCSSNETSSNNDVITNLTKRMEAMEENIQVMTNAISKLLNKKFDSLVSTTSEKNNKKRQPLRKVVSEMS